MLVKKSVIMSAFVAMALVAAGAQPAFAAKKKKKTTTTTTAPDGTSQTTTTTTTENPPPPPPPPPASSSRREEAPPPPPPRNEGASTNRPSDFGSGYLSWGTRGGATLGTGNGARADIFFGNHFWNDGFGYAGVEGQYIFGLSPDIDLGVGARLPFWPFGIAPGAQLRWRLFTAGQFQLALDASLHVPISFGGFGGIAFGISVEPGVMMSYFLKDNMELYFGLIVPVSPILAPNVIFQIGFDARVGFAYTLKKSNIGFFAGIDLAPGLYGSYGFGAFGFGNAGFNGSGFGFGFDFIAGAQFRL